MKIVFMVLCCVVLLLSPAMAYAQDDETPEQKKVMQTLEEREKIAAEEPRESNSYDSPEEDLMYEKEKDRAAAISERGRVWVE